MASEDSIDWEPETLRALPLAVFRDNYRRYRIPDPAAKSAMQPMTSRDTHQPGRKTVFWFDWM
ncbi:MAG: hypothetical protein NT069_15480 [Planctomycetota bacterium]|nr:hypothetical protein [Planctomycetota bacterium]